MPKIECRCEICEERFQRVVLRNEKCPDIACPKCLSRQIIVSPRPRDLFNGISNFSTLAKDTN